MAETTYSARAVVLRRTRLKETDLIITALASDGRQIRAVAKGARKPSSPFSSRLDLFTEVDLLCAKGRGDLDIVKEARIVHSCAHDASPEFAVCAAVMAETAEKLTHSQVCSPKLFSLTCAAFGRLADCFQGAPDASQPDGLVCRRALSLCAAYMLKAFAFTGFRPMFSQCAVCGCPVDVRASSGVGFSVVEGGVVCGDCRCEASSVHLLASQTVAWAAFFLGLPFDGVCADPAPAADAKAVLRIARDWMKVHAGLGVRSLGYLLECGLL